MYVSPTPLMCQQKGLGYRDDHRDGEEVAKKRAVTKKCHSEWKLLNMPFGKPFFFHLKLLPATCWVHILLPEAKAWERMLKLIRFHFPCPGFHDGYFSPLLDRCTMTSLFTAKMSKCWMTICKYTLPYLHEICMFFFSLWYGMPGPFFTQSKD